MFSFFIRDLYAQLGGDEVTTILCSGHVVELSTLNAESLCGSGPGTGRGYNGETKLVSDNRELYASIVPDSRGRVVNSKREEWGSARDHTCDKALSVVHGLGISSEKGLEHGGFSGVRRRITNRSGYLKGDSVSELSHGESSRSSSYEVKTRNISEV